MEHSQSKRASVTDLRAVVDELWTHMDDNMGEDAQTGEHTITLNKEQAERLYGLYWQLGGKYRRGLEECGWSPGGSDPEVAADERAAKAERVLRAVEAFASEQEITCAETIHQSDRVIENAYEFIEKLCDEAGYYVEPQS